MVKKDWDFLASDLFRKEKLIIEDHWGTFLALFFKLCNQHKPNQKWSRHQKSNVPFANKTENKVVERMLESQIHTHCSGKLPRPSLCGGTRDHKHPAWNREDREGLIPRVVEDPKLLCHSLSGIKEASGIHLAKARAKCLKDQKVRHMFLPCARQDPLIQEDKKIQPTKARCLATNIRSQCLNPWRALGWPKWSPCGTWGTGAAVWNDGSRGRPHVRRAPGPRLGDARDRWDTSRRYHRSKGWCSPPCGKSQHLLSMWHSFQNLHRRANAWHQSVGAPDLPGPLWVGPAFFTAVILPIHYLSLNFKVASERILPLLGCAFTVLHEVALFRSNRLLHQLLRFGTVGVDVSCQLLSKGHLQVRGQSRAWRAMPTRISLLGATNCTPNMDFGHIDAKFNRSH